jgi:hypothetical protein
MIEVLLKMGMFLRGPCRGVILKTVGSSVRGCVKRGLERLKLKNQHSSPAVARERLVKTQQTGKCLAGAVMICELRSLAIVLYLLVITSRVCK